MKKLLYILLFLTLPAGAQDFMLPPQMQTFVANVAKKGIPLTGKDYVAAYHAVVGMWLNVTMGSYDSLGAYQIVTQSDIHGSYDAAYLFIGRNRETMGFNIINPDTAHLTAYYMYWNNSPTAGDGFMQWNGSSQWANTGINSNIYSLSNGLHMTYHSVTRGVAFNRFEMGGGSGGTGSLILAIRYGSNQFQAWLGNGATSVSSIGTSYGVFTAVRTGVLTTAFYLNGVAKGTPATGAGGTLTGTVYFGGANQATANGTPGGFTDRSVSFGAIGTGSISATTVLQESQIAFNIQYRKQ